LDILLALSAAVISLSAMDVELTLPPEARPSLSSGGLSRLRSYAIGEVMFASLS
jgi:hypothetical protein